MPSSEYLRGWRDCREMIVGVLQRTEVVAHEKMPYKDAWGRLIMDVDDLRKMAAILNTIEPGD